MRAILRAGAYEIRQRADVPARVSIKEYVDVAGAFFWCGRSWNGQCGVGRGGSPVPRSGIRTTRLNWKSMPRPSEDELIATYFAPLAGPGALACATMPRSSPRGQVKISS